MSDKLCLCGSNQPRQSLYDARGIFCCYVCDECKLRKAMRYRIEVLEDPNYDHDEPLESYDHDETLDVDEAYQLAVDKAFLK